MNDAGPLSAQQKATLDEAATRLRGLMRPARTALGVGVTHGTGTASRLTHQVQTWEQSLSTDDCGECRTGGGPHAPREYCTNGRPN